MPDRIPFRPTEEAKLRYGVLKHAVYNQNNMFGAVLAAAGLMPVEGVVYRLGATYEDLEATAKAVDMNEEQTEEWISLAESIPLSDEIAKYIRGQLEVAWR